MQRLKKLQDGRGSLGMVNGGRLSADGNHFTLDQLQRKRKKLGEGQRTSNGRDNENAIFVRDFGYNYVSYAFDVHATLTTYTKLCM